MHKSLTPDYTVREASIKLANAFVKAPRGNRAIH